MPTPTTLGLSNFKKPSVTGSCFDDNSKDRMNELFNDFKRLNIQDSNVVHSGTSTHINHSDLSAANDENRKPVCAEPSREKHTGANGLNLFLSSSSKPTEPQKCQSKDKIFLNTTEYEQDSTVSLYVGDLDKNVTEKSLSSLFSKYQSFLSAKLCYSPSTRLSLGYGYVNFSSAADADRAIEDLNYTVFANKEIRIMPYLKGKDKSFMSTNVFVSNLNTNDLTLRSFYEKFKHIGTILSCKLDVRKRQGFISFESKETAENFVKNYNTALVDGTNIHCSIHIPKSLRNFSSDYNGMEVSQSSSFPKPYSLSERSLVKSNTEESLDTTVHTPIQTPAKSVQKLEELKLSPTSKLESTNNDDFNQVYVKGLPITVTEEEIEAIFDPFGRIVEIYKETVANFRSTWCLITFETHQSAVDAIAHCHKVSYKGKKITCVKALKKAERQKLLSLKDTRPTVLSPDTLVAPKGTIITSPIQENFNLNKPNTTKLFVYNLPKSVNENFFKLFLKSYSLEGKVLKYSFQHGSKENYIEFEKKSDAVTTHQKLNGVNLSGLLIQTSLIQLDDGVKNQASKRLKVQDLDFQNVQHQQFSHSTAEAGVIYQHQQQLEYGPSRLSTNFHPIGHSATFHSNPSSPPIATFQAPSLSTYSSVHSLVTSVPSLSTHPTVESASGQAVIQNFNGKPYRLIPVSNPPGFNENQGLLNYHDLYSSPYETKLSESLQGAVEKLALRQIDFLSYPSATRPNNLKKVLNYLFMTFWDNSAEDVEIFMQAIEKHPEYINLFKGRLIAAIKILGYER